MDSLNPESAAALTPIVRTPPPPRIWKFWATTLWGLFIFAVLWGGHRAVVAGFVLGRAGPFDIPAAIQVVGGGLTFSPPVMRGLPAVLAALWIATRWSRTPFTDYLALRWT